MEQASHGSNNEMTDSKSNSVNWDEIELSESYLVCGMSEEAAALASSILARLHENGNVGTEDEIVRCDMMASAAMVLVQSWKESGRTSDLLNELKIYFGSVSVIPVQVVLTGSCVQVSSGHSTRVCTFLEEFLANWRLDDDKYYANPSPDGKKTDVGECARLFTLEVDQYLEVVEFYALTLGSVISNVERAVSWVEKAQLPEQARQDLLRRLLSLSRDKSTSSPQGSLSSPAEERESHPLSVKEVKQSDKPKMVLATQYHKREDAMKLSIWERLQNITQRFRNAFAASNGKILFGCLLFLICYFIRKKRDTIMRALRSRALSVKQALVDLWQLAFSYQVNPLAAVQPLPASTTRSR